MFCCGFISWHDKPVYMPISVSILDFWKLQVYIFMINIYKMISYYLMFKLLYLPSPLGRCVCVNKSVMALAKHDRLTSVYTVCCCHYCIFCECIQMILKVCTVTSEDIYNYHLKWDSIDAVYIE